MSEEKTKSDLVIAEGSQFSAETSTDYSPGKESIGLAVTATGITYNGTTGNDSFTGGKEDDHLRGGDGNDWLSGGLGDDVLKGDTGNDTLNGGAGADVLEGGAGNDSLYGGEGLDSFIFAAGHGEDVITDNRSSDIGNDVLRFNGASSGSARFSRESNSLIIQAYGADDRVSVTNFFVNGESSGEFFRQYSFVFDDRTLTETDLLSGVTSWGTANNDNESGWYGVDLMYGGLGNDSLSGGSGNDVLNGGAGDDTLGGGAGDDILEGGSGNDRLSGNEGLDTFIFAVGHGQDVVSDAPSTDIGNDTLRFTGANSQNALFSRKGNDLIVHAYGTDDNVTVTNFFNNPETLGTVFRQYSFVFDDKTLTEPDLLSGVTTWDTEGNDNALGWYGVDLMYGGLGNDSLRGGSGNDVLHGGVGDDTLGGGAGVDILEGGSGNDLLSGNGGLDTFMFAVGHGQDVVSDAPSTDIGNDTLRFTGANSQNALFSRKGNDLVVHAYGTDDNVTVTNFFNNSEIPGTAFRQYSFVFDDKTLTEPDLLSRITSWGTAGNDTEWGWYGNDIIYGGAGNDSLSGVSGDDILNGGLGNDNLFGGDGADTYHFAAGHGKDLVNDVGKPGESNNTLRFNGAESGTTRFSRDGSHLTIQAYGSDDSVMVSNYFAGTDQPGGIYRQFSFVFDDATLTEADLARSGMTYNGTDAGNNASGWYAADLMYGAGGNDTLQGGGGNDVLNGGAGNDSLNGNSGEDTYQFTAGHGKDHVYDSAGSGENGDILRFTGASSGAARFSREGANLIIQAYESDDSVTVSNYFAGTDQPGGIYRQFSFVFDDATLTEADLARSGMTYNGTDLANNATGWYAPDFMYGAGGNDTLQGGGGNDVLNGGAGNDSLNGNSGEDTYQFTAGHGKDHVYDSAGSGENGDILRFTGASSGAARFSREGANLIIQAYGSDDSVTVSNYFAGTDQPGGIYRQFSFVFDDATLTEADLARSGMTYNGTDAGNNASGWYAADLMYGAGGNDTLQGGGGNDVLNGGAGNDSLNGNSGEDTYQFTAGHGKDHVYDSAGSGENGDILRFTGASSGVARFSREGANLIIQAYESDDSVTVSNYFAGTDQPGGIYRQFSFVFDDATLTEADLARSGMTYNGTDLANNATGWYAPDFMYGAGGNDTLQGGGGNDVLNGGAGNDSLNGNSGEDTYQFTAGHGNDYVYDNTGAGEHGDILRFTGANAGSALFSRDGRSLVIKAYGSDDSVTVSNYFGGTDQPGGIYRQFSFVFDDATLTESDLARSGITYNGTEVSNNITGWYGVDLMNGGGGNDTLSGGSGDDVLNGGVGNDTLSGEAGQDTYLFANGHGSDRVTDSAGMLEVKDIIEFSDLNLTDLWFSKSNSNLLITESGSQDSVEVMNWYSSADSQNKVIHTHDGYEIDAAQVQQLVEAMSTFAATHSELSAADQQTGFMHSVSVSSYLEAAK